MDYQSSPVCAREFFEQAIVTADSGPSAPLMEVRRFANAHDTAEFSTEQRVVISCRLAGCAVTLTRPDGRTKVDAPDCPSQPV